MKPFKIDNSCYRKVRRAIIEWGAIEKWTFWWGYKMLDVNVALPCYGASVLVQYQIFLDLKGDSNKFSFTFRYRL